MESKHRYNVPKDPLPAKPKAVVLLLGWWGGQLKHLNKYAEIYQEVDCVTLQTIVAGRDVLTWNVPSVERCALKTASHVARVLEKFPDQKDLPVIIHAFSNGGIYVLHMFEQLVLQAQQKDKASLTAQERDVLTVQYHVRGQLFDSAPAYPDLDTTVRAFRVAFRGPALVKVPVIAMIRMVHALFELKNSIFGEQRYSPMNMWRNMQTSELCLNQAFLYSTDDEITPVKYLEDFIEVRRRVGSKLTIKDFKKSAHVQHLRKHPDEYKEIVVSVLNSWTKRT